MQDITEKKPSLARAYALGFFLLFSAGVFPWVQNAFFGHTIKVRVMTIQAYDKCNKVDGPLFEPKEKLAPITLHMFGRCGGVKTENGAYRLPSTDHFWGPHQSREELLKRLKPGCLYEVRAVGFGEPQAFRSNVSVKAKQTIWWIDEELGCA